MHISQKINLATAEHEVEFGKKPTKLYLGRVDWEELRDLAWEIASYVMKRDTPCSRSEYRGMAIYTVDDENYLAVGV